MDMTLSTRKVNKSVTPTILVMQRLHQEDCTGNWLDKKGKQIKHICLPGEVSKDVKPLDLTEKYIDGLLDPIRLSKFDLSNLKIDLGSYGYAGQIMQTPAPEEGGEWKKEWFKIIDKAELPPNIKWEMFIDGAYTKETKNDPTGIQISGKANNNLYIYSSIDKYLEMPELKAFIEPHIDSLCLDVSMVLIEPKASGKSLKQLLLSETKLNVSELKTNFVSVSKIERARSSSPYIESGRVILVKGAWNDDFLHQVTTFPNAKHDEHVDITAYAIERNLIIKESIIYTTESSVDELGIF
jgi:predicted phage terminase large subunit-like protein